VRIANLYGRGGGGGGLMDKYVLNKKKRVGNIGEIMRDLLRRFHGTKTQFFKTSVTSMSRHAS